MSLRGWVLGSVAGAVGVAAGGTAIGIVRQQREISRRAGEDVPFGTLRAEPMTVLADDGLPLHVEVDEVPAEQGFRGNGALSAVDRLLRRTPAQEPTVVFAHGYCLNLDSWHFQRAAYRGLVRTVYYDQRSHGRSGDSDRGHATIEQLGRDLRAVIDAAAPEGPVVLVGHSMGGMSIVAFAELYPELIGTRVVGLGLISTTAGGLDPTRILLPMLPARLMGPVAHLSVRTLRRGHFVIDRLRHAGSAVATVATDRFAFGSDVPKGYVEFVDEMLSATPFETVAEFFPNFAQLDKFHTVEALGQIPVSIICGTADKLTSIGHSRKLHARIPESRLLECEGAGHMVPLECHDLVNAELDQLITAAVARTTAS